MVGFELIALSAKCVEISGSGHTGKSSETRRGSDDVCAGARLNRADVTNRAKVGTSRRCNPERFRLGATFEITQAKPIVNPVTGETLLGQFPVKID